MDYNISVDPSRLYLLAIFNWFDECKLKLINPSIKLNYFIQKIAQKKNVVSPDQFNCFLRLFLQLPGATSWRSSKLWISSQKAQPYGMMADFKIALSYFPGVVTPTLKMAIDSISAAEGSDSSKLWELIDQKINIDFNELPSFEKILMLLQGGRLTLRSKLSSFMFEVQYD